MLSIQAHHLPVCSHLEKSVSGLFDRDLLYEYTCLFLKERGMAQGPFNCGGNIKMYCSVIHNLLRLD